MTMLSLRNIGTLLFLVSLLFGVVNAGGIKVTVGAFPEADASAGAADLDLKRPTNMGLYRAIIEGTTNDKKVTCTSSDDAHFKVCAQKTGSEKLSDKECAASKECTAPNGNTASCVLIFQMEAATTVDVSATTIICEEESEAANKVTATFKQGSTSSTKNDVSVRNEYVPDATDFFPTNGGVQEVPAKTGITMTAGLAGKLTTASKGKTSAVCLVEADLWDATKAPADTDYKTEWADTKEVTDSGKGLAKTSITTADTTVYCFATSDDDASTTNGTNWTFKFKIVTATLNFNTKAVTDADFLPDGDNKEAGVVKGGVLPIYLTRSAKGTTSIKCVTSDTKYTLNTDGGSTFAATATISVTNTAGKDLYVQIASDATAAGYVACFATDGSIVNNIYQISSVENNVTASFTDDADAAITSNEITLTKLGVDINDQLKIKLSKAVDTKPATPHCIVSDSAIVDTGASASIAKTVDKGPLTVKGLKEGTVTMKCYMKNTTADQMSKVSGAFTSTAITIKSPAPAISYTPSGYFGASPKNGGAYTGEATDSKLKVAINGTPAAAQPVKCTITDESVAGFDANGKKTETVTFAQNADGSTGQDLTLFFLKEGKTAITCAGEAGDIWSGKSSELSNVVGNGITFTAATLDVSKDSVNTVQMKLNLAITEDVTVKCKFADATTAAVATDSAGAGAAAEQEYTFTSTNWNVNQNIFIKGVADGTKKLTCEGSSANFTNVKTDNQLAPNKEVDVTVATAAITKTDITGATIQKDVVSTGLKLKLASKPTATVELKCTSADATTIQVMKELYTFTTDNWDVDQGVQLKGLKYDNAGVKVTCEVNANSGGYKTTITKQDQTLKVHGNVVASAPTVYTTSGSIEVNSYTIKLGTEPTAEVKIECSKTGDITLTTTDYTFTTTDWNTAQTVKFKPGATGGDITCKGKTAYTGGYGNTLESKTKVVASAAGIEFVKNSTDTITTYSGKKGTTTTASDVAIKLTSAPNSKVTVTCVSSATNVVPNPTTDKYFFYTDTYSTPQAVVLNLAEAGASSITCTADAVTGSGYTAAQTKSLQVTSVGLVPSATKISATSKQTLSTYNISLSKAPANGKPVTVTCVSTNTAAVTIPATALTFTNSNAQTITLTLVAAGTSSINCSATQDADNDGTAGEYNGATSSTTITVADSGITGSFSSKTLTANQTDKTYTLKLNSAPSSTVTVTCSASNAAVANATPSIYFFYADETNSKAWNKEQSVTIVTAQNGTSKITCTANTAGGYSPADTTETEITVTSGVVATSETLTKTTGSSEYQWKIKLSSAPTGTVTVTCASSNTAVVQDPVPASVTFTTTDYNTFKAIPLNTVSAGTATVTCTPSGGGFDGKNAAVVTITVNNAGITGSSSTLSVAPSTQVTDFTIKLDAPPSGSTIVTCLSDNASIVANPATTTYTFVEDANANNAWNKEQKVQFNAVAIGSTKMVCTPSGGGYTAVNKFELSITVGGQLLMSTNIVNLTRTVTANNFFISLGSAPSAEVSVSCATSNSGVVAIPSTVYKFTSSTFGDKQSVQLTANGAGTATITCTAQNGGFNGVSNAAVVNVADKGITLSPISIVDAVNKSPKPKVSVKLNSAPTGNVVVECKTSEQTITDIGGNATKDLTFSPSSFSVAQEFEIDLKGVGSARITCAPKADAGAYDTTISAFTEVQVKGEVKITDTNAAAVSKLSGSNGDSETLKIELGSKPTGDVTVTCTSGNTGVATVANGASKAFNFDVNNYNSKQDLVIAYSGPGTTSVTCQAGSGGGYDGANSSIAITVSDAGIVVSKADISTTVNKEETFTVKLNSEPEGNVTVNCTPANTNVIQNPTPSQFTFQPGTGTSGWATAKEIKFKGRAGGNTYFTCKPTGDVGAYKTTVSAQVNVVVRGSIVSNTDTSTPANELTTTTGGSYNNFQIRLGSAPLSTITVNCLSDAPAIVNNPNIISYSFTTANWASFQTVAVTMGTKGTATVTCTAQGSGYTGITSAVKYTVVEPGIVGSVAELAMQQNQQITNYTIKLASPPAVDVTVQCASDDVTVVPNPITASYIFQPASYDTPKQVVLNTLAKDGTATITCTANNAGGYTDQVTSTLKITVGATQAPTEAPTEAPTDAPTNPPTNAPTNPPTNPPTNAPTNPPTNAPTNPPTNPPTNAPTNPPTNPPTNAPTNPPTDAPTGPTTAAPTGPTTAAPTGPTTAAPTDAPTRGPSETLTTVLGLNVSDCAEGIRLCELFVAEQLSLMGLTAADVQGETCLCNVRQTPVVVVANITGIPDDKASQLCPTFPCPAATTDAVNSSICSDPNYDCNADPVAAAATVTTGTFAPTDSAPTTAAPTGSPTNAPTYVSGTCWRRCNQVGWARNQPVPYAPYAPVPYAPVPYAPMPYAPRPYAPYAPRPYAPYAPTPYAPYSVQVYAPYSPGRVYSISYAAYTSAYSIAYGVRESREGESKEDRQIYAPYAPRPYAPYAAPYAPYAPRPYAPYAPAPYAAPYGPYNPGGADLSRACSCDRLCSDNQYNDCCADYAIYCSTPAPTASG